MVDLLITGSRLLGRWCALSICALVVVWGCVVALVCCLGGVVLVDCYVVLMLWLSFFCFLYGVLIVCFARGLWLRYGWLVWFW